MAGNWDYLFKCDNMFCENERNGMFWVNCKFCDRFYHTGCIGLPNKDYKTIRCKPCWLYMTGQGPPVPPKEPMPDHLIEAYVAYYRRMFDDIVRNSERVYDPATDSRYTNGHGLTNGGLASSSSESDTDDSWSYCGSSCSCNDTDSTDPLSPYESLNPSDVENS